MKIATCTQMKKIDETAIKKYGISQTKLMENAGKAVFDVIVENYPDLSKRNVLVLVGKGNNGGDGLVVARLLREKIFAKSSIQKQLSSHGLTGGSISFWHIDSTFQDFKNKLKHATLVIDALFGTGLHSILKPTIQKFIQTLNQRKYDVVSIDIPSGIHGDTGKIMGEAVKATITVTLGFPKIGLFLPPGIDYVGKLEIRNIGFPKKLLDSVSSNTFLLTENDIQGKIFKRTKSAHKGQAGHVLVVAGSKGKSGAAVMTVQSAFRTGAGLVTLLTQEKVLKTIAPQVKEAFLDSFPKDDTEYKKYLSRANVLAIGPGIGFSLEAKQLLEWSIKYSKVPIIIDADALTLLSQIRLPGVRPIILTPHPGEMAKLLSVSSPGLTGGSIQKNRIQIAQNFAQKNKVYLILKGAGTILAMPDGKIFVNSTGNPAMATAGMGDVLTGMIASFIAQGLSIEDALKISVYLHGKAADTWTQKYKASRGLLASDIIKLLPKVIEAYVN